ncbi:thymidine phosphorylase [candidate division KSB1 bacterium]|nr:thymidine phosphorylase [candidate division KSB1 bacterium]NIR69907.1 thymidine phosphorylase [candidate division KSB1 bacterium]NIS25816.1 thymidine phosphorylase [candidate division KSB1 bacterium]NIT72691.1 thymidine phosphorylase [candidate division KSB1 bacterium]NIU26505.1 thymidine phosphorylase [candidate division KSB1 bacterium]
MNPVDLITKKRDGQALTADELQFLVSGYVQDNIPDYQLSAFLMAVYFSGMTADETAIFTQIMRDSGRVLELSAISGFKADKHSTGGVGDKVSLVLAPLVASAGLVVPMISGRALGHTGGTLDKLESIPNFRTDLTISELTNQLQKIGVALIGQTDDLCPADKKIYALRDATGTVQVIPLITASILSKKMAAGIDALVLDVKAGKGAIFKDQEKAWQLARMLVNTAAQFQLKTTAIITSMQQPLGNAVGNWLEAKEAIETLNGNGPADLAEVTLTLGAQMLVHGRISENLSDARAILKSKLENGDAFNKFVEIVEAQGGDLTVIREPHSYPAAKHYSVVKSPADGVISDILCREIGKISMELGAGRNAVTDPVDYTSGIYLNKKVGDRVSSGDILATAFSNEPEVLKKNESRLQKAFKVMDDEIEPEPLIYALIDTSGERKWDPNLQDFTSP